MKLVLRNWFFTLAVIVATQLQAVPLQQDTVYLYNTWASVFDMTPNAMLLMPHIEIYTPYDIEISSDDDDIDRQLRKSTLAATIGDSIWLINSQYLRKNFKGDSKRFEDYVPLFFNDKVAFVQYLGHSTGKQLLGGLLGDSELFDNDPFTDEPEYYHINFATMRVERVTSKYLSSLLTDYRDLLTRYESMKDYKERYMINDFFLQWVERMTIDPVHPFILDQIQGK